MLLTTMEKSTDRTFTITRTQTTEGGAPLTTTTEVCTYCYRVADECECPLLSPPRCEKCFNDAHVLCNQCGNEWVACDCQEELVAYDTMTLYCASCQHTFKWIVNPDEPYETVAEETKELVQDLTQLYTDSEQLKCYCPHPKQYFCSDCGVARDRATDPWVKFTPKKTTTATKTTPTPYSTPVGKYGTYYDGYGVWGKDRHTFTEVKLFDGTIMYCSSVSYNQSRPANQRPEFGLYFDWSWKPVWRSEFVDWQDYGIPTVFTDAADAIIDHYERAKNGMAVEIGCIGGHGRTGTALACMAVLAGQTPDDAIHFTKTVYCEHAIETGEQEWWVEWFEAYINGKRLPKNPYTGIKKWDNATGYSSCTVADHYIMHTLDGRTSCSKPTCTFWEQDSKQFASPSKWTVDKCDEERERRAKIGVKSETVIIDGYKVPKPGKHQTQHVNGKEDCECDYCRYTARGFGAFLEPSTFDEYAQQELPVENPDAIYVNIALPDGTIQRVQVAETWEPMPPTYEGSEGDLEGEFLNTKSHGWVWVRHGTPTPPETMATVATIASFIKEKDDRKAKRTNKSNKRAKKGRNRGRRGWRR